MNKKTLLWCILSIVLVAYLVFATIYSVRRSQDDLCKGVDIEVYDPGKLQFVTAEDINMILGNDDNRFLSMKLSEINTHELETRLNNDDKIESANCVIYNNGRLKVNVIPLVPLARVFDNKKSYYINQDGKRMAADARFHVDVPVIVGHFDDTYSATSLLPLLEYIQADSVWNSLVSGIKVTPQHDILISPMIKGHVIVFGDTSLIENKFNRLSVIYKDVMAVKGWTYYDTISVKWKGQVVATRREKHKVVEQLTFADSINEETVSVQSMDVSRIGSASNESTTAKEILKTDVPVNKTIEKTDVKTKKSPKEKKKQKTKNKTN